MATTETTSPPSATSPTPVTAGGAASRNTTTYAVIVAVSLCHLLNDVMQSLLSAIYPILAEDFALQFWQIGLLTLVFQGTASMLQPVIGLTTDRHPMPQSLPVGMGSTMLGLGLLAYATTYPTLLFGAALIGIGSAVFHPEASRVARLAAGGRYGMAQSVFQVGGSTGQAIGPLLAAFIVVPLGRPSIAWFALAALAGIVILNRVGAWYARLRADAARRPGAAPRAPAISPARVRAAVAILAVLVFSKAIYTAGISSYYTFFLIDRFGLTTQQSQVMLFLFMAALAFGTVLGGPLSDRMGSAPVIWVSVIGVLPFTLALPHVDLTWTAILSVPIGVILALSFPVIVVFAQELMPGRVGMVAGIFFGLSFGLGGIAAAVLGVLADAYGIGFVFLLCSITPAVGLAAGWLPRRRELRGG
jgi:MFS transporter, FSR family, fosmidomycin resistance protein